MDDLTKHIATALLTLNPHATATREAAEQLAVAIEAVVRREVANAFGARVDDAATQQTPTTQAQAPLEPALAPFRELLESWEGDLGVDDEMGRRETRRMVICINNLRDALKRAEVGNA